MSDLKNELSFRGILPAAPAMTRAQSNHISCDSTGRYFAYGSANVVFVRDLENASSALICTRHSVAVTVARIAPSGLLVASGDKDGNVIVWANRPETTEKYRSKQLTGAVRDISWTADSERIVVVGEGRGDYASVFTVTGSSLGDIIGHTANILTCDFRKVRPFKLFTGGADTKVGFYEGPPFKFTHSVTAGVKNSVTCVRVSPDNRLVAIVSGSNEVLILDAESGKEVKTIPTDHQGTVYAVAWTNDGRTIATASADKSVKTFNVDSGALVTSTNFGKTIAEMQQGVFFTSTGLVSVSLSGALNFLSEGGVLRSRWLGHQKNIVALYHDPSSNNIVSIGTDGQILKWGNGLAGDAVVQVATESDVVTAVDFEPHSKKYYAVAATDVVTFDATSTSVSSISKEANHAIGIKVLASGFVALLYRTAFTVLDASGKKVHEEKLPQFEGTSIAAHGNLVAIGGDKIVKLFNVTSSGKADLTATFQGTHTGTVTAVAFSPDGTSIASGDSTKAIFVWSVADQRILFDGLSYHTLRVSSLCFQTSNRLISGSVDCSVIVWDLAEKKRKIQDQAHRGGVFVVAAAADGEILTAGGDNCIRRWSL